MLENLAEIRRTRSGRAVKTPQAPKQTRKTRKKMVLVEVEVSEDEDDIQDENNLEKSDEKIMISKENEENTKDNVVDDSNSVQICNESSLDQNDSRSMPLSSKNESEIPSEQNSNQETFEMIGQDSIQTENSTADEKTIDISVLNNDSQTQCKPDEKDFDNDNRNGVSFISVRSMSSLFDSSDKRDKSDSEVMENQPNESIKTDSKVETENVDEKMDTEPINEDKNKEINENNESKSEKTVSMIFFYF